jgi:hypothetical protein
MVGATAKQQSIDSVNFKVSTVNSKHESLSAKCKHWQEVLCMFSNSFGMTEEKGISHKDFKVYTVYS